MQRLLAALALSAAALTTTVSSPAFAHAGHNEATAAVPQSAEGDGVVRGINARAGTITIAHGPMPSLRWPAMTMTFRVQSAELLRGVTVGRRIHFVLQNRNGRPVVVQIHPV